MITFAIVHFNTPELTSCLCGSILKNHPDSKIVIFDNSTCRPFDKDLFMNVVYYDNTNGQIINFDKELQKYPEREIDNQKNSGCNFGSVKHSLSIEWLCNNLNENFVLLDSDVLLKRPIDFIDENYICISDTIKVYEKYRMSPMMAYINVSKMKENNIHFFDGKRMHSLTKTMFKYDTGMSFYEDCCKVNLFKKINSKEYIEHYGNGSWRNNHHQLTDKSYKNISAKEWLIILRDLWK